MNVSVKLPTPTQEELTGYKIDYFYRIIGNIDRRKYNLSEMDFSAFIHHTYESMLHSNKHITLSEFKKIMR
jgi:hypothetical protein